MRMDRRNPSRVACLVLTLAAVAAATMAAEPALGQWPQWGGPNRDFAVESKGLANQWLEGGPRKVWFRELGDGYAIIVLDGAVLYTMYRKEQDEFTVALDSRTGKILWEYKNSLPTIFLME